MASSTASGPPAPTPAGCSTPPSSSSPREPISFAAVERAEDAQRHKSDECAEDAVGEEPSFPAEPHAHAVVLEKPLPHVPLHLRAEQPIQAVAGPEEVVFTVNPLDRAAEHEPRGLPRPALRIQLLGGPGGRLARLDPPQVGLHVARVDGADSADVSGGPQAESEIGVVRPVD